MSSAALPRQRHRAYALLLVIGGLIGWIASFELLVEKIETLVDPTHVPACNISVLVSCGPNMNSAQGSVFGFPNPIIGIACFVAPIVVGMALLAGARFAIWFWSLFALGMLGAIVFISWLAVQSIFVLGTLCPYCLMVWIVVIALFWYTVLFVLAHAGTGGVRAAATAVYPWAWLISVLCYVVIAVAAQLRLDVVANLLYGL